jgi:hypothetical protein
MPDKLEDLSLLWAENGALEEECVCCGKTVENPEDPDDLGTVCHECGRRMHLGTCSTRSGGRGKENVCKLCDWLFKALDFEREKQRKEKESLQHQNLHASLRAVDATGASPTKIMWSNHIKLRLSTIPKHPDISIFYTRLLLCTHLCVYFW